MISRIRDVRFYSGDYSSQVKIYDYNVQQIQ